MIFSIAYLAYFFYVLLSFCRLAISAASFLVVFDNSQICKICHFSAYNCDYLNDYLSSYAELLEKSTSVSMETKRLHTMVYEILKTLNNLNPVFMKDILHYSPNVTHKKLNLYIHTQNTTKFMGFSCKHMKHITWIMFHAWIY